jgi:hypothetical protein
VELTSVEPDGKAAELEQVLQAWGRPQPEGPNA